jgi:N-acyl-D-aspartate/D-glutamate deacylase
MTSASYDPVIRNARLIDGTGSPSRAGDLAIEGERIAEVVVNGAVACEQGRHTYAGTGRLLYFNDG